MKKALPQGWIKTSLGNICKEINSGSGFPVKYQGQDAGDYPFAKVGDLSRLYRSGKNTINSANNYISRKQQKEIKARVFLEKTIVFPKIGEALKNNYRLLTKREMLFDNNVMGVTPDQDIVSPEFIYYFLLTQDFGKFSVATAIPSIRKGDIESIEILLPPEHEQKSIVAKIEELFSELDSGIASLKTAQEQLKIYRQALLKHAFEGKLTEQWRKDNADKLETPEQLLARIQQERETRYQQQLDEWKQAVKDWEAKGKEGKKPSKPAKPSTFNTVDLTINELSELPDNWRWMYFGDLVTVASNLVSPIDYPDLPHIAPDNIERNTGKLLPYKTISEDGVTSPKHYFYAGQIIYSKIRPNLSKLTLIDFDGLCSADMYPLQSDCYAHSFLKYLMLTKSFVTQSSTAGSRSVLPKINQAELSKLNVPICNHAEQQEIVNQLEEKLSIIEQNEKEIESALAKAELLRQSILKKAFSGKLTNFDSNMRILNEHK